MRKPPEEGATRVPGEPSSVRLEKATMNLRHVHARGSTPRGADTCCVLPPTLQAGLVDEVLLVRSTVEHADPVPSGLDDDAFRSAGLEQHEPLTWGEERVDVWLRA